MKSADMVRKVQQLDNDVYAIYEKLDGISKDVKKGLGELRIDVRGLKTDVSGLKTDVSGLKTDVSGLKTDVSELKTDVSGLKATVAEHSVTLAEHSTKLDEILDILRARPTQGEPGQ